MLPSFCRETVTVTRAARTQHRGTFELDWSAADAHQVAGCLVRPVSTTDDQNNPRPGLSMDATLYAPPGADVAAQDRVTCQLGEFRVVGFPMVVNGATGRLDHVKYMLERREG